MDLLTTVSKTKEHLNITLSTYTHVRLELCVSTYSRRRMYIYGAYWYRGTVLLWIFNAAKIHEQTTV